MPGKQVYDQMCPLAGGLDRIGGRWALLIVRELVLGPRRFSDIRTGLESASTDMVTNRLNEMMANELVDRSDDRRYSLTPVGRTLLPVLRTLSVFGLATTGTFRPDPDEMPDPARRLLGSLAVFNETGPTGSADGVFALKVGDFEATAAGLDGRWMIRDGVATSAHGSIETATSTLFAVTHGGGRLDGMFEDGSIRCSSGEAESAFVSMVAAGPNGQAE